MTDLLDICMIREDQKLLSSIRHPQNAKKVKCNFCWITRRHHMIPE